MSKESNTFEMANIIINNAVYESIIEQYSQLSLNIDTFTKNAKNYR
jgi:hypothetical protein